jgi:two-component system, cell cycle response regulator
VSTERSKIKERVVDDVLDETTQNIQIALPHAPTVLVVDDDHLVLAHLKNVVEADGYTVITALSGAEALDKLDKSSISIVVTDLNMPKMDGLDLCRRIRARPSQSYVYVFLLTVRGDEKDVLAGFEAGADDYLNKRSSAALFTARLRTANRVLALEYSLKDALEKKRRLVMSDPLTGVYNLRYLIKHVGRELKRSERFGGSLSLLLLDIDRFKDINDNCGHAVGDFVLKKLTRQITQSLRRETDWCARLGGDEFAVVLEGTKISEAQTCAEKLRQATELMYVDTPSGPLHVTVSIGISSYEGDSRQQRETVQSLLERADANLYSSKAHGRNRVSASTSQRTRNRSRFGAIDGEKATVRSVR